MLGDAKSMLSEAYLSIRSNLAFSNDHGVSKALMVNSTRPAEGKSTTSIAIATVLGRNGNKVLLIDADMRSPSINTFVDVGNKMGLSNFLADENDLKQLHVDYRCRSVCKWHSHAAKPSIEMCTLGA